MQIRKSGVLLTSCLVLLCGTVMAEDSETQLLRQQITQLQKQLLQLSQRLEVVESQQPEPQVPVSQPVVVAEAAIQQDDKKIKEDSRRVEVASNGSLLKFASDDGNYKFQVGGRIHADATVFDDDLSSFGNGSQIRRARIFVSGTLFEDWEFKNQIEFTGSDSGIRDSYLRYTGFDNTKITIGNFKEPFSQEELASSNHIPFIERASINEFAPSRAAGIGIGRFGNYGGSENSAWTASFGVFGEGISDRDLNADTGVESDEGLGVTGRFSTALVATEKRLLHLGSLMVIAIPAKIMTLLSVVPLKRM